MTQANKNKQEAEQKIQINKEKIEKIKNYLATISVRFFKKTKDFSVLYNNYLLAFFISFISLFFFLTISYSDFFSRSQFFNLRIYGIVSVILIVFSSYLLSFLSKWNFWKSILVWIQSSLLIFFSFAYFLNINNKNFHPIAITVLVFLIFLTIKNLFARKQIENLYLLFSKIFLFSLTLFTYLEFLLANRVHSIEFNQELLAGFFNLTSLIWFFLTALAISLFSVYSFSLKGWKSNILYGLIFFIFIFQLLLLIQSTVLEGFFYWDKAILLVIFWNFLYIRIKTIAKKEVDLNFWSRTYISTAYHVFLSLLVLIFSLMV